MKTVLGFLLAMPIVALSWISDCSSPIFVDQFKVTEVTFEAAVEALRIKSKDLDELETDPSRKGVNIILKGLSAEQRHKKVSLELRHVPMTYILDHLCRLVGARMQIDSYAVVIMSQEAWDTQMHTRRFRVPPGFLSSGVKK